MDRYYLNNKYINLANFKMNKMFFSLVNCVVCWVKTVIDVIITAHHLSAMFIFLLASKSFPATRRWPNNKTTFVERSLISYVYTQHAI